MKGYVAYDLPFGRGRTFLNSNSVLSELAGGWRISGTMIAQSGNPFTVTNGSNENSQFTGRGNNCQWYPNVIASTMSRCNGSFRRRKSRRPVDPWARRLHSHQHQRHLRLLQEARAYWTKLDSEEVGSFGLFRFLPTKSTDPWAPTIHPSPRVRLRP